MFEDSVQEKNTKVGLIRKGDLAVVSTKEKAIMIVLFTELYSGQRKKFVRFHTLFPASGVVGEQKLSWEEFERTITKLGVFGQLPIGERHWNEFVNHYRHYQLIQKAESLLPYHIAEV